MSLETLHQILDIAAPLVAIVGVIIALIQLHNQSRLRQFDTVMRLFLAFGEERFMQHYRRVTTWDYDTYDAFKKKATENDNVSLMIVSVFYENMGLLYKRKLAPLELLDDLNSAPIINSWKKVKPIWFGFRAEYKQPQWVEYYELLAEDMIKRLARSEK
jgi:hypothetical protein